MAISASLSLYGIYQYDDTILDGISVPVGMNVDTVKNALLIETSSMSILYPDAPFLKKAIQLWSVERFDVWQKLFNTTVLQYNPIENYDRIEETTENVVGNEIDQRAHNITTTEEMHGQNSEVDSRSQNRSIEHQNQENSSEIDNHSQNRTTQNETFENGTSVQNHSGSNETTNSNTAYNSNSFADTSKGVSSGSDNTTGSNVNNTTNSGSESGQDNTSRSGNVNQAFAGSETLADNGNRSTIRNDDVSGSENKSESGSRSKTDLRQIASRIHGNIGVTSSQQLIESERKVAEFCMVDYIVNDFISRFCVMVY